MIKTLMVISSIVLISITGYIIGIEKPLADKQRQQRAIIATLRITAEKQQAIQAALQQNSTLLHSDISALMGTTATLLQTEPVSSSEKHTLPLRLIRCELQGDFFQILALLHQAPVMIETMEIQKAADGVKMVILTINY